MKRFYIQTSLLATLLICFSTIISCSSSDSDDGKYANKTEGIDYTTTSSSSITADNYPSTDLWLISDSAMDSEDFAGISAAINDISNNYSSRRISLDFPYLTAIPDLAIYGVSIINISSLQLDDYNFSALESVSAENAESIGAYSFTLCTNLKEIYFPSVTMIGYKDDVSMECVAFYGCKSLVDVYLPKVETLGDGTFHYCSALRTVDLPATTTLYQSIFNGCTSLTSISLSTDNGSKLINITTDEYPFTSYPENVTLTLGTQNKEYVNDNTLTIGDFNETFKEILWVEN